MAAASLLAAGAFLLATTLPPRNPEVRELVGEAADGRDVLLKVSPGCERCIAFTSNLVLSVHPSRVVAVSLLADNEESKAFTKRFGIPVVDLQPKPFYDLGGCLDVPRAYWVRGRFLAEMRPHEKRR